MVFGTWKKWCRCWLSLVVNFTASSFFTPLKMFLLLSVLRQVIQAHRGRPHVQSRMESLAGLNFKARALCAAWHRPLELSVPHSSSCALGLCQFRFPALLPALASIMSSLSITSSCPGCLQGSGTWLFCQARVWAGHLNLGSYSVVNHHLKQRQQGGLPSSDFWKAASPSPQ